MNWMKTVWRMQPNQITTSGMQLISNLLATGTCAGFAVTVDTKRLTDADPRFESIDMREFYDKAYASASLLLLAFCSTAMLSIVSSYTHSQRERGSMGLKAGPQPSLGQT
ncbi:unnamed protein product [Prunus armeniaca]|uniref:CASP-like protein n=1 Tax=Prunus armeniaca TaxID=36596 RepID=A0A6J5U472_PRUAR|nr:unnamed protein product [Prunus armeniaca]